MAAGDEFPLDVILIIVAVIVVLFIAIFFGGLISTRLRKRNVFTDPSKPAKLAVGVGERFCGAGDSGGGASKVDVKLDLNKFIEINVSNMQLREIVNSQLFYINNLNMKEFEKIRKANFDKLFKSPISTTKLLHTDQNDANVTNITNTRMQEIETKISAIFSSKVDTDTLSTDIVNLILSYNVNIPVINQTLYMSTYTFIINRIKDRLGKYKKAENVNNLNKFVNSIRAVINTNMTDTLIKSTFLDTNNKQDLLIRHLIWNSITENDISSTDKFQYKLTDFVNKSNPDNSEDDVLTYFNAAPFIRDLIKHAKTIIKLNNIDNLGKMNNIIYKRRSSIDALVASLGTLDRSSYTDINSKNTEFSNAFKGLKFDIGIIQPDKTQKYITNERDGINTHNNHINDIFTKFIHPIGAIIKFNNGKSTDPAQLETELNVLKNDKLSLIHNAFNAQSDNELFKILKTYADSKIAEYDTIVNRLKNQKQLESDLTQIIKDADIILTSATNNYAGGEAIVKDIETRDAKNDLNKQLDDFKKSVDNQLGFAANIEAKKSEFDSKASGTATLQIGEFGKKYNSVLEQTSKFIALLGRVHGVTKQYHGEYSKLMKELSAKFDILSLSELTKKSSDIDSPYQSATYLSGASADVSKKLGLRTRNIMSKDGKLHKEITDINAEITTHRANKDDLNNAITKKVQDEVAHAVVDVTARIGTTQVEITRITGIKDTIKSVIDEKIMKDGITPADALAQTDKTITEIAGLHAEITALKPIPTTEFTDLISNAGSVAPVVSTTELNGKIKEYNDLIQTVTNFATECSSKIFTDAVANATKLNTHCTGVIASLDTTKEVDCIREIVLVEETTHVHTKKYIDIAGKINNTHADYIEAANSFAGMNNIIKGLWTPLKSYVPDQINYISNSVTQANGKFKSVSISSDLTDVNNVISEIETIMANNNRIYDILNDIFKNSNIVASLDINDVPKINTTINANIQKVGETLAESKQLQNKVELKSVAAVAAAAVTAAAATAATSIAAAVDTDKLKFAAEKVKETITEIKTGYDSEYDLNKVSVKNAALADVETITDKLPGFKQYVDDTRTYLTTIKTDIVAIPGTPTTPSINDAEITRLNDKVTTVENELATINTLYNELDLLNTTAVTAIDNEISNNDEKSFTDAIRDADAICDAIITGIDNRTITSADVTAKTVELDNIINDTIHDTIMPARANVIGALKTKVSVTIKTTVTDPNAAKVATIEAEIAKKSFDSVITDALAASKKLVDAITNDKAAINTIITDIDKLPPFTDIVKNQTQIVRDIDLREVLNDPGGTLPRGKINAIDALNMIAGIPGLSGVVDKIQQHIKTIRDNLAIITTANNAIDTADGVAQDGTKSLTDRINGMVKIHTEYNNVNPLKSICDTANDEIKKLKGELDVLIEVIQLSDNIVKDNIKVFNINEDAKTKLAAATAIRDANQLIKNNVDIELADMQNKVNRIIAKVSSVQDPYINQAVNSVNNEFARLQQTEKQINTKLAELNKEYMDNIYNKQAQIALYLNTNFKDNAHNFEQDLAFWINEIKNKSGASKAISDLSDDYARQSGQIQRRITTGRMDRKSNDIDQSVKKFAREKTKVTAALKQAISVYQLIMDNDDDDDAPAVTQPDDDKVKPFSQNSYDILPLNPKVATLSSNMQFSESKSAAANNPVNSFMYNIVPYDSQELSSDDKVLEILSFARTQRMPLIDATNIIAKAEELIKKYRGTKKVIPGAWVYRGGKLFSSVKPTKIEELERYIELMRRSLTISDGLDRGPRSGGGTRKR